MLIPILHFEGNCTDAIALYEKAFDTRVAAYDYDINIKVRHAELTIQGQTIYLNDAKKYIHDTFGVNCNTHLTVTFNTPEELLACYRYLKSGDNPMPFVETPYSKLVGNFVDKFGVLWGFMVRELN